MVHAGLPPQWSAADASARARELEGTLTGPDHAQFLANMYGDQPDRWSDRLAGWDRLRFITNALTRTRYVDVHGTLDLCESGPPGTQDPGLVPWYQAANRRSRGTRIVFGHWATLQIDEPLDPRHGVLHLDHGCVWGGRLSAMRLCDQRTFSVPGRAPSSR